MVVCQYMDHFIMKSKGHELWSEAEGYESWNFNDCLLVIKCCNPFTVKHSLLYTARLQYFK